jgi:hypothetical protein
MTSLKFLEAFNAKVMSENSIARTFVPSTKFRNLAGAWNALLIGPRGSGKTTYLRMLELRMLRKWRHPEADHYRSEIGYSGIYVPSDIAWGAMVDALGDGKLKNDCLEAVAQATFCTNVLQAAVNTIEDRIHGTPNDPDSQYRIIKADANVLEGWIADVADAWKLEIRSLSLDSLRSALGRRLIDIKAKSLHVAELEEHTLTDVYELLPYADLDFHTTLEYALIEFDARFNERDGKWALLLDEFEIAPIKLQKFVFASLRSTNKKLIYKVAIAPCGPHTELALAANALPTKNNDFRQIELWYGTKNASLAFCEQLFLSRMADANLFKGRSVQEIFGQNNDVKDDEDSDEDDDTEDQTRRYRQTIKDFTELSAKDESFHKYLADKKIDPLSPDFSDSRVRKIAPIVAFRNAFRGHSGRKGRKKFIRGYTGWEAIAAISEGNPRWLIAMLNLITAKLPESVKLPIAPQLQYDQILETTEAFASMVQTIAMENPVGITTKQPILGLLSKIGRYFNRRLIDSGFIEEPPMSFEVDSRVADDLENALRLALNNGAIVCLSDLDDFGGARTLREKRFRLAYLLAPSFNLPLRSTKEISLTTILTSDPIERSMDEAPQGKLF